MSAARNAQRPVHYERLRPEETLLYQIVEQHYPDFLYYLEEQGTTLPGVC